MVRVSVFWTLAVPLKLMPFMVLGVVREAALPVVFWFNVGKVQFARLPDVGVPNSGVTNDGLVPKEVNEDAVTPEARVAPLNVPAAAVTVILAVPSKLTPFMVRAVVSDAALPVVF